MATPLSRRELGRLASAAFGGVVAGTLLAGCSPQEQKPGSKDGKDGKAAKDAKPAGGKDQLARDGREIHACRGLNTCKGNGADGKNDCAGQGTCATVDHHSCGGQNTCKHRGGCGTEPGTNECKGKGGCAVPMVHGDAWDRARAAFEGRMKEAKKTIGKAPARE